MRGLLWVVGVFAAAVALSLALQGDAYVLVTLPPWRLEVSLVFALLVLLAAFVAGYFVVRFAAHAISLPSHVRAFRQCQRETRARKSLIDAMQAQLEGRYARVDKLAGDAWEHGASRALACLIAARAANRRRDYKRRDEWLERARVAEPEWRNARLALEAELLADERRFDDAKRALGELHAGGLRHLSSQQLLLRCEQALGNWEEVIRLAQQLAKRGALAPEALESIVSGACIAHIGRLSSDLTRLAQFWKNLPAAQRLQPRIAAAAARAFMQLGDGGSAHRLIEDALDSVWEEELVRLYGECRGADTLLRIERGERWLSSHPQDALLLLVLGGLCVECKLWGKAQSYLEASLAIRRTRAAHIALAGLFDAIGRVNEADREYRASAEIELGSESH
ncbi:MAG: hypothetical protein A3H35_19550 [Betaproteobacteria bacterium RIFCSPLOWO2_02_FULL_62_17]|nr:MAG: hypothetical protein A3H35_19550 [Betaproteobacteria bacterium RIFCSPLOWO2_02_FULL_62_17]